MIITGNWLRNGDTKEVVAEVFPKLEEFLRERDYAFSPSKNDELNRSRKDYIKYLTEIAYVFGSKKVDSPYDFIRLSSKL